MKHRILLISYVFPPFPGVGGRRWAKFARYLADAGHEVHLICAKNILKDQSAWTHDVLHPGIFLYPLPARYPSILLQQPATFFEKLLYKFWQTIFMLVSNGSIFERALFWKKQLHKKAIDLIQSKRIETVIVSGPPFHLLHHAVAIKEKMNNLHVIVDLRDPWTDNKDFFGFSRMSKSRLAYEQKLERETMLGADAILTVASKMSEALVKKYPAVKGKVFTLINGFDPREVTTTQFEGEMVRSEKMRFVYAGSLYPNLEYVFIPFAEYLVRLRKKDPHLYSKLVFDFYGSAAVEMKKIIDDRKLNDIVHFYGWIPRQQVGEEIAKADLGLLFFGADHAFSMNTKLFEYLAQRKPVILFSAPGTTPDFLIKNELGFPIHPGNLEQSLDHIIKTHFSKGLTINTDFKLEQFSIPSLTQDLMRVIEKNSTEVPLAMAKE